jgi:hypothetical protein
LEVGTVLRAGAVIQTAANSYVDIVLDESAVAMSYGAGATGLTYRPSVEQDMVRIFADSVLAIDRLMRTDTGIDQVTRTELDLRSGKIFGTVKKLSAGSEYLVKIPNGVAGIRGTSYTISADGIVSVFEGSVVVAWTVIGPDGKPMTQTQVVVAGYQFNTQTSQVAPVSEQPGVPSAGVITTPTSFRIDRTIYFVSPVPEEISPTVAAEQKPNLVGDKK